MGGPPRRAFGCSPNAHRLVRCCTAALADVRLLISRAMAAPRSLREIALERTFSLYFTHFALWLTLLLPVIATGGVIFLAVRTAILGTLGPGTLPETVQAGMAAPWTAVLVWALVERSVAGWFVLALATILTIVGQVVKYTIPGRRLRDAGIPKRSILAGAVLSIVGFFVIPVVGFIIGFVVGVYLAERYRLGNHVQAWPSTKRAMRAAGLSILIELVAGLGIAGSWAFAVLLL